MENLDCPNLIAQFEQSMKQNPRPAKKMKMDDSVTRSPAAHGCSSSEKEKDSEPHGFDRRLKPEVIIGATELDGERMFLMQWENCDEADLVPAKLANIKCPHIVIQFYEDNLKWCDK